MIRTAPWQGMLASRVMREHAVLLSLIGIYCLAVFAVSGFYHFPNRHPLSLASYTLFLLLLLVLGLCGHAMLVMIFARPPHLTRYLLSSLKSHLIPPRLLFAAPVLLLIPLFSATFSYFKSSIPTITPYTWDVFLIRWDYLLHGGNHPWILLQPVLGYPIVTAGINFLYGLWFFIMYSLLTLQAFDTRNPALRMRLLLSFVLSWIVLGTFFATAFASMGPCFAPDVSASYGALMDYLRTANEQFPVRTLETQQMLWDNYQHNRADMGKGISAMPSMHVAIATLMALFGWQYSRWAGIALTLYALVIFIGSIHLAWHYALDGYAGAVGAGAIWWLVGRWQSSTLCMRIAGQ